MTPNEKGWNVLTMCGILGWMKPIDASVDDKCYKKVIEKLFLLSETRGKEASGVCFVDDKEVSVLKAPIRAKNLIGTTQYNNRMNEILRKEKRLVMGHARMVTNGSAYDSRNNQPVVRGDLVCIHNGIIVNDKNLWESGLISGRTSEVDTEAFLALLEKYDYKSDIADALRKSLSHIEGSLSVALVDVKQDWLFLYTNIGSLYFAVNEEESDVIFSSERYILETAINEVVKHGHYRLVQLPPGKGIFVDLSTGHITRFESKSDGAIEVPSNRLNRDVDVNADFFANMEEERPAPHMVYGKRDIEKLIDVDMDKIHALRRCKKCLLPETFPGITFDNDGVCSVCRQYNKIEPLGKDEFVRKLKANKTSDGRYDCIAPLSGGRDSCFILHYLVKELGLKPVAYTYDWGLVTDLARRNIQRMCAALGVEHILVSADINKKRENVRKNVNAWLKKPSLGTVPLFMAGDKQFFYYAQLLKKQMRVDSIVFGMNRLEETLFKARFIGINSNNVKSSSFENFSKKNTLSMAFNYGKEFIGNPKFLNSSLLDSLGGYLSYYALPRDYIRFFDYIQWNQNEIEDTLINDYNWELASDTNETWRIGDGTAPFYNYIYYRMAGFTEFDTFFSNQIREGLMTREEALEKIDESNKVSIDGFLWYCKVIGLNPMETLKIINSQRTLYDNLA